MTSSAETVFNQLSSFFRLYTDLDVWILEYGISHHVMLISIHQRDYPYGVRVKCGGCCYFAGDVQGGPYSLSLNREASNNDSGELFIISDDEGQFIIKCSRLSISTARGNEYEKLFET